MFSSKFRLDADGSIAGHGLRFDVNNQIRPGIVALDVDQLESLFELARLESELRPDDGTAILSKHQQKMRDRQRVEDAKADLIESLGLDPDVVKSFER